MSKWTDADPRWAGITECSLIVRGHVARALMVRGPNPSGTPSLLIHGLGGSAVNWVDVMVPLAASGPVVAVDLPGFGGTPVPSGGSARVGANAAFVAAVAETLGWGSYRLFGNSMGGLIATLVAAAHPEAVDRLVLLSPALPPASPNALLPLPRAALLGVLPISLPVVGTALLSRALTLAKNAELTGREEDATQLLELLFTDPSTIRPALLDAMASDAAIAQLQPVQERSSALAEAARSLTAMWLDPREALRAVDTVTASTLLIGGELDPLVSAKTVVSVGRRRPDWTTWIAARAGHVLMLDQPDRFLDELNAWLAGGAVGYTVGRGNRDTVPEVEAPAGRPSSVVGAFSDLVGADA